VECTSFFDKVVAFSGFKKKLDYHLRYHYCGYEQLTYVAFHKVGYTHPSGELGNCNAILLGKKERK